MTTIEAYNDGVSIPNGEGNRSIIIQKGLFCAKVGYQSPMGKVIEQHFEAFCRKGHKILIFSVRAGRKTLQKTGQSQIAEAREAAFLQGFSNSGSVAKRLTGFSPENRPFFATKFGQSFLLRHDSLFWHESSYEAVCRSTCWAPSPGNQLNWIAPKPCEFFAPIPQ